MESDHDVVVPTLPHFHDHIHEVDMQDNNEELTTDHDSDSDSALSG